MSPVERRLRDENETLREEVRQLRELLAPPLRVPAAWNLSRQECRLFCALTVHDVVTYEALAEVIRAGDEPASYNTVKVIAARVRRKLSAFNIEIRAVWAEGYTLADRLLWARRLRDRHGGPFGSAPGYPVRDTPKPQTEYTGSAP